MLVSVSSYTCHVLLSQTVVSTGVAALNISGINFVFVWNGKYTGLQPILLNTLRSKLLEANTGHYSSDEVSMVGGNIMLLEIYKSII